MEYRYINSRKKCQDNILGVNRQCQCYTNIHIHHIIIYLFTRYLYYTLLKLQLYKQKCKVINFYDRFSISQKSSFGFLMRSHLCSFANRRKVDCALETCSLYEIRLAKLIRNRNQVFWVLFDLKRLFDSENVVFVLIVVKKQSKII